ncbi:MAG TPA: universal stress protein [Solirubrobacteraceae bacterium]|nr:universal stress protein [Solirubrobacteraceae bacterium]
MITVWIVVVIIAVAAAFALAAITGRRRPRSARAREPVALPKRGKRILFPFVASALSTSALEAALRIAAAEGATLMPVFLARVPMHLPLQAPLPKQSESALMLQEAIEQRAAAHHVPVDARIERGRDNRHALRQAIASCSYDRIVISAAVRGCPGFDAHDVAWLLENAPGEILVLRAADSNHLVGVPAGPSTRDERAPDGSPPAAARARLGDTRVASLA